MDSLEKSLLLFELELVDRKHIKKKAAERIEAGDHEPSLYALADSDDMNDTEFAELAGSVFALLTAKETTPSGLAAVLYGYLGSGKVMQSDAYRMLEMILEKAEESAEESFYIGNLCIFATAQDFLHPIDMTRLLNKAWPQAGYPDRWTHLVGRESDVEDIRYSPPKGANVSDIEKNINKAIAEIKKDAVIFVSNSTANS